MPAFSVPLDPPPRGDAELASRLARLSAERFGRDVLDVELDIQSALERVRGPRRPTSADAAEETGVVVSDLPDIGVPAAEGVVAGAEVPES